MVDDVGGEEHDADFVEAELQPCVRAIGREALHQCIEEGGEQHVRRHAFQRIGDGVVLAPHEVARHHCRAVARHACPGASHVAEARNAPHVYADKHKATQSREPCAPNRAVGEFVPKGKVEINAHHDFGGHHHGHHFQSRPVVAADEVFQDFHVAHNQQEGEEGEDEEVFHRLGVGGAVILVGLLAEHKGFVGVAEGLRYHRHNHGNLHCRAVDAELHLSFFARHEVAEEHLVGRLVEDAGDAEYQYRPGVGEHAAQQPRVEAVAEACQFAAEEEGDQHRAEQVDAEGVAHADGGVVEFCHNLSRGGQGVERGQQQEEDEVEADVEHDEKQFQRGKLYGFLLIAQIGEGYALESVDCHAHGHHAEVFRVVGIAQRGGYLRQQSEHGCNKQQPHAAHGDERGGIDAHGVFLGFVYKAEEGGFHAEGEQHE